MIAFLIANPHKCSKMKNWKYMFSEPRGHPVGVVGPEGCSLGWSLHMRSGKPYKHEHGRKYWHYFIRMGKHPKGWLHLYETLHGMICLYGKVMLHFITFHSSNVGGDGGSLWVCCTLHRSPNCSKMFFIWVWNCHSWFYISKIIASLRRSISCQHSCK